MPEKNKKFFGQKAQSIIELSLLGAALLGILGLLVSYAISLANSQETQLKAMRAAMKLSADESAKISQYGFLKPQGGNYYGSTTEPSYKSGHRKSAAVLVIEDKLTVQGGEKYGSTSLTPTISFGSGTVTNLLQYPMRYGDPSQLPYLDMYINGQHFAFTTSGYKYQHFGSDFCNQNFSGQLPRCLNNVPVFNGTNMWFWEGSEPKMPVAWTKIPRTDKRFCYGPNDPASHRCNRPNEGGSAYAGPYSERFRLDPLHGTVITDMAERKKLQWQWYPVPLNDAGIRLYEDNANNVLDIDYDGHEETIMNYYIMSADGQCTAGFYYYDRDGNPKKGDEDGNKKADISPNSPYCNSLYSQFGGAWKPGGFWVVDPGEGDIASEWNEVDKKQGIPKPGFNQNNARIFTAKTGSLAIQQTPGKQPQNTFYDSQQKQKTYNIIEREIQLSNDTGRFIAPNWGGELANCPIVQSNLECVHNTGTYYTGNYNPNFMNCISRGTGYNDWSTRPVVHCYMFDGAENGAVKVACKNGSCWPHAGTNCQSPENETLTCFDRDTKILYVRTLVESRTGHKYRTIAPAQSFP